MGMFDWIKLYDEGYTCSEGHDMRCEEFQTKDLDCMMYAFGIKDLELRARDVTYNQDGSVLTDDLSIIRAITEYLRIYTFCSQCPAFVTPNGGVLTVWVEFRVHLVAGHVASVERVSKSTAEWLQRPDGYDPAAVRGPMSHADALKLSHSEHCLDAAVTAPKR